MTDSSDLIKPGEIPGKDINIELITLSASNLRKAATRVRDHGAATVTNWSTLAGSYTAPDAEQLFGVMTPVGTNTTTFGDHLDIATGALEKFAEEIAPIKAELDRLRAEAWAFVGKVSGGVDVPVVYYTRGGAVDTGKTQEKAWHEDDATVDKNNQFRIDVNTQVELMWAAERKAANTIRALYCAVPLVAGDGSDAANMYMYDEIPDDAEVPWGHPVERTEGCGEAAVSFVFEDFLWEGVIVGGVWGTVTGLGGLISYNSQTGEWGDWKFAGQAWTQLGHLAYALAVPPPLQALAATQDNAFGEWNRESPDVIVNTLKGIVAWDQWAENPGAAAGTAVFNVGTIFIPAGAAITSIKGGALASKLATAARVMDYLDASSLALKAGTGAFRFTSTGLGQLSNVLDGLRVADNVDSQIPTVNGNTISLGDNVVSGVDEFTPPVREDVHVDVPVREPVEVGGGSGGGSGHPTTGGGSSGLPEGPGGSPLDDSPTGGSHGDGAGAGDDAPVGAGDDTPTNQDTPNGHDDTPSSHDDTPSTADDAASGHADDPAGPDSTPAVADTPAAQAQYDALSPEHQRFVDSGDVRIDADGTLRIGEEVEVAFKPNPSHDPVEFWRQIDEQQQGLNDLTLREWLDNRAEYLANGRSDVSTAAQAEMRIQTRVAAEDAFEAANPDATLAEIKAAGDAAVDGQAALHVVDGIAGGFPDRIVRLGDSPINSSIGSQWRWRVGTLDDAFNRIASMLPEELVARVRLDVRLGP